MQKIVIVTEYLKHPPEDPFIIFHDWFESAKNAEGLHAHVMHLASVNYLGQPSLRTMMLHSVMNKAFLFFTNLQSRKSLEILDNPHIAICFYWPKEKRQVRIEGVASKAPDPLAEKAFQNRPTDHKMSIIASDQSRVLLNPADFEQKIAETAQKYGDDPIDRPKKWGGFAITPSRIEFWQEQPFWMHERLVYTDHQGEWSYAKLYP